jgi:pimeloyl-ACP methyl ester carboxylesterase
LVGTTTSDDADVFVLKFPGTGGRAERLNHSPLDAWLDLKGDVWSVNPPGYGGSSGQASLSKVANTADAVYAKIRAESGGRPLIVVGNSLGCIATLYLAANYEVDAIVLRNPPPLRQLIVGKHGWWNLWVGAMLVSQQVPDYLCSISNAERSRVPALFVSSRKDTIVPPNYQVRVMRAYAGPKRIVRLREANHSTPLNSEEQRRYADRLRWLRSKSFGHTPDDNRGVFSGCV